MTMSDTSAKEAPAPVAEPVKLKAVQPPIQLTLEERQQIEILYLKVENLALQQKQLQADIIASVRMRQDFQNQMSVLTAQLSQKYGVDIAKAKINPVDGTVTVEG
jgi:hypothetical protein